jgi:small subunit ribosomal protein S16
MVRSSSAIRQQRNNTEFRLAEKRSKRDGRFVESVGYYDPCRNPADVKINRERVKYWMERGAQPSETVRSLINRKVEPSSAGTLA